MLYDYRLCLFLSFCRSFAVSVQLCYGGPNLGIMGTELAAVVELFNGLFI